MGTLQIVISGVSRIGVEDQESKPNRSRPLFVSRAKPTTNTSDVGCTIGQVGCTLAR